jgi:dipeptidyl aminopeptidase/acylaminoacyl peptidase
MLLAYSTDLDISYVVSFAGPTKMYGDDPDSYPRSTLFMLENLFGGTYEQLPELYRQGSPYYYLGRYANRRVPILLAHDRTDAVVPFKQSEIMFERAAELGIESELLELSGVGHDIEFVTGRMANRGAAMQIILDFIYKNYKK